MISATDEYLKELNEAQKEAVRHKDGPLLVVAGAGAGKTRVIAFRIFHLIQGGVDGRNILAVTFTNKAAKEMRERVLSLLDHSDAPHPSKGAERPNNIPCVSTFHARGAHLDAGRPSEDAKRPGDFRGRNVPLVSTFHALGAQILRDNAEAAGISRYFTILDQGESLSLIKQSMKRLGIDPKNYNPNYIQTIISRRKGDLDAEHPSNPTNYFDNIVAQVSAKYEELLTAQKSLDFDDLLLRTVRLFERHERVLQHYQNLWKYIHIDEYQDTNAVQYQMAYLLAREHRNICVVGDTDQSIYNWRGADFRNILNFEKHYEGATVIVLEENYRSTQNILTAANAVIAKNELRKEKNLFTRKKGGDKIALYEASDEGDEANFVAETVIDLLDRGVEPSSMAVLYRANFQSRVIEEAMLRYGVNYQMLGTRFFERKEVKDLLAYVELSLNPEHLGSLKRALDTPKRGIGAVTLEKILEGKSNELSPKIQEKMAEFNLLLSEIRGRAMRDRPSTVLKFILQATGNLGLPKEEEERAENLAELVSLASKYDVLPPPEGIQKMLTESALASEQDSLDQTEKKKGGVKLMTIHASKGLEFKHVFVVGLEQGLFPHDKIGATVEESEEERRLFYVALTRAEKKLYLSYAFSRLLFGQKKMNLPSQFLGDIPSQLFENAQEEEIIQWESIGKRKV